MLQCVAVCCSVLQCVAVRYSLASASLGQCVAVLCNFASASFGRSVAVSCSALPCVVVCHSVLQPGCCIFRMVFCNVLQCWQCVAACCNMLQCAAVCCSVLQCVAVCCSVFQCVAVSVLRLRAGELPGVFNRNESYHTYE